MIEMKNVCACLCVRVFRLINVKIMYVMHGDMILGLMTNLSKFENL
jgi:hypothetical protein